MKQLKARLGRAKNRFVEKWKAALIAIGIVLVPLIVWKVPEWQVRAYHGKLDANAISKLTPQELIQLQKDLITAENDARVTIAQIIGGLVVLLGLYATFKNVKVAEEGKLTERFSKAVELLGSDKLDVRLGGIYALERIARDSQKDHWTVMEVLTAFIREQSKLVREQSEKECEASIQWAEDEGYPCPYPIEPEIIITVDLQAALTVIGRRKWVKQEKPHQRIDLSGAFLKGADLRRAKLQRAILKNTDLSKSDLELVDLADADLNNAKLSEAMLRKATLINANLYKADLSGTILKKAKLKGAHLNGASLISARLDKADLSETSVAGTNLTKATLVGADFTEAIFNTWFSFDGVNASADLTGAMLWDTKGLTWEQISETIMDETTKLPPELEERRKVEQKKKAAAANN